MKIENIGSYQTLITRADGMKILYSYSTPVACLHHVQGFLKTETFHSRTTSKHIEAFCGNADVPTRPQKYFDTLL